MAIVTNTFRASGAVGNREELSDMVNRITPEDTPIYSMIRKESASNVYCEWETDELEDPAENAQAEGDQYSYTAITPPVRQGNYTQIFRKSFIISNTQQAIRNAGNAEKIKYQSLKKGIAIRKDVEKAITDNQGSASGNTRKLGALPSWIKTNVSGVPTAKGTYGGFASSSKTTAKVQNKAGQTIALATFTKSEMDKVMQSCYVEGANVKDLVLSAPLKEQFVSFMSDSNVASFRYQTKNGSGNRMVATADIYEGPYGMVRVVPNRVMRGQALGTTNTSAGDQTIPSGTLVYLLDRSRLMFKWLRKISRDKDITANADAKPYVIIGEGTLKVNNEASQGMMVAQQVKP